jgi:hypothetical protein
MLSVLQNVTVPSDLSQLERSEQHSSQTAAEETGNSFYLILNVKHT